MDQLEHVNLLGCVCLFSGVLVLVLVLAVQYGALFNQLVLLVPLVLRSARVFSASHTTCSAVQYHHLTASIRGYTIRLLCPARMRRKGYCRIALGVLDYSRRAALIPSESSRQPSEFCSVRRLWYVLF